MTQFAGLKGPPQVTIASLGRCHPQSRGRLALERRLGLHAHGPGGNAAQRVDNLDRVTLVQVLEVVEPPPGPQRLSRYARRSPPLLAGRGLARSRRRRGRRPRRCRPTRPPCGCCQNFIGRGPGSAVRAGGTNGPRTPMAGISNSAHDCLISATKGPAPPGVVPKGLCPRVLGLRTC